MPLVERHYFAADRALVEFAPERCALPMGQPFPQRGVDVGEPGVRSPLGGLVPEPL